jgi:predicted RNase H-like HicB family nuclease
MQNVFTAVIEQDGERFVARCPEVPEANGQGKSVEECRENLSQAISLILEDRREDASRSLPDTAVRETDVVPPLSRKNASAAAVERKPFDFGSLELNLPPEWTSHKVEDLLDILEGPDRL